MMTIIRQIVRIARRHMDQGLKGEIGSQSSHKREEKHLLMLEEEPNGMLK